MVSWRSLFPFLGLPLTLAAAMIACGDDAATPLPTDDAGGGASSSSGSSSGSSGSSSGSSGEPGDPDGGPTNCDENPVPPDLSGTGPCGTLPFGGDAIPFSMDAGDFGVADDSGTFPPGIYDTVHVDSPLMAGGSWRETTVVGADGRFTRVRHLQIGGNPSEVTYRSGTFQVTGDGLRLMFDCMDGDAATPNPDAGTIPFEVTKACGATYYRTGSGSTRASMKRR
jgi:hypothetical protein